jgi:uncharacterized protein (DUF433 family)
MRSSTITQYTYITSDPQILHGSPIIAGTRTPVRAIAESYTMGMSIEAIKNAMPYLSESQIFSALAFYFDFREEIDEDIRENNDFEHLKSITEQHPATKRIQ